MKKLKSCSPYRKNKLILKRCFLCRGKLSNGIKLFPLFEKINPTLKNSKFVGVEMKKL